MYTNNSYLREILESIFGFFFLSLDVFFFWFFVCVLKMLVGCLSIQLFTLLMIRSIRFYRYFFVHPIFFFRFCVCVFFLVFDFMNNETWCKRVGQSRVLDTSVLCIRSFHLSPSLSLSLSQSCSTYVTQYLWIGANWIATKKWIKVSLNTNARNVPKRI